MVILTLIVIGCIVGYFLLGFGTFLFLDEGLTMDYPLCIFGMVFWPLTWVLLFFYFLVGIITALFEDLF